MKLVVIGNGFDMAHGLKTGYDKFKDYILKNDTDEYNFLEDLFGADFSKDDFWWNFEESLAKSNFENFTEAFEIVNDLQKKNGFEDEDCEESNKNFLSEHIYNLKKLFCEWIDKINNNDVGRVSKKNNLDIYFKDSLVLSFNYTSTVEWVYDVNVFHIHGYIENIDLENEIGLDSIILGHSFDAKFVTDDGEELDSDKAFVVTDDGESIPFNETNLFKQFDSSNSDFVNNALSDADIIYQRLFTKRCNKIINDDQSGFFESLRKSIENIDEIVVLGHSISEVDRKYFETIIEILKNKHKSYKWIVSYFGGIEAKNILENNLLKIDKEASIDFITINGED